MAKKVKRLTTKQLERKLEDPCSTCREVQFNQEACLTCNFLHRTFNGLFDDPVELTKNMDTMLF